MRSQITILSPMMTAVVSTLHSVTMIRLCNRFSSLTIFAPKLCYVLDTVTYDTTVIAYQFLWYIIVYLFFDGLPPKPQNPVTLKNKLIDLIEMICFLHVHF